MVKTVLFSTTVQVHNYGLILTQNHLYQGKPDVHYLHEYQRGQNSLM